MIARAALFTLFAMVKFMSVSSAAEYASKAEARAHVQEAIAFYQKVGAEKAFSEFNDPKGKFVDRDLYIFVLDKKGTQLAMGANPALVGLNRIEAVDLSGRSYVKQMIDVAMHDGSGWIEYNRTNPANKQIEDKVSYVQREGDYIFGCGAYGKK